MGAPSADDAPHRGESYRGATWVVLLLRLQLVVSSVHHYILHFVSLASLYVVSMLLMWLLVLLCWRISSACYCFTARC